MKKQNLLLEKRSVSGMHRTENKASGHSHVGYVFQDKAHRAGQVSGEVYFNKALIAEKGEPVSITIHFDNEE